MLKRILCFALLALCILTACNTQTTTEPELAAATTPIEPTAEPTMQPTELPPTEPTAVPTVAPTTAPTDETTSAPTNEPAPAEEPTAAPAATLPPEPTNTPQPEPSSTPVPDAPTPTAVPTEVPSAANAPTVVDFSANLWIVGDSEPLTLSWEVIDATDVMIFLDTGGAWQELYTGAPVDSFTLDRAQNHFPVPPVSGSNNQYFLVANNEGVQTTHSIRVTYDASLSGSSDGGDGGGEAGAFAIEAFALTPDTIMDDSSVMVSWHVPGAVKVEIITFTSDINPELVLIDSAESQASQELTFFSLPTYMFDSYGLDRLTIMLRAHDADGNILERSTELLYGRPVEVVSVSASPTPLPSGQSLTINFDVTWSYSVEFLVQRADGSTDSIDGLALELAYAGQPRSRSAGSHTLTWEQLTGNGTHSFDSGEIVLTVRAGGPDGEAMQTITIPIE